MPNYQLNEVGTLPALFKVALKNREKSQKINEMVDRLANDAMDDIGTIPNNPRKVVKEDIVKIYKKVLPLRGKSEVLQ